MIPRLVGRATGRWVDRRLRLSGAARHVVAKIFPDHWSFMLGEIALYCFVVLIVTGTYLTMFFEPSTADAVYHGRYAPLDGSTTSAAFSSTVALSWDVRGGLLVRQAHHWAALIFIAAIVVHLCRVFFTGAFRRPREVNWLVGVTLLLLGLVNGFAGYSLPDDLLSGTGLRIASAVVLSIPIVGTWLQFLLFGGEFPGDAIEQRLYAAHVLLVPGLILALVTVHMAILVRQKHTQFPGRGRRDTNVVGSRLWPTYAFRSVALLLAVAGACALLGGLVQINPVWIWGPFDPSGVTAPAQPDWYIGWLEGALRLFPPWDAYVFGHLLPAVFWPAVVFPGLTFLTVYAWPWIERSRTGDRAEHHVLQRPREVPGRVAVGVGALTLFALLLVAGGNDIWARELKIPLLTVIWVMRVAVLVGPVVAAAVAYWLSASLRRSDAESFSQLPASELARPSDLRRPPERTRP